MGGDGPRADVDDDPEEHGSNVPLNHSTNVSSAARSCGRRTGPRADSDPHRLGNSNGLKIARFSVAARKAGALSEASVRSPVRLSLRPSVPCP